MQDNLTGNITPIPTDSTKAISDQIRLINEMREQICSTLGLPSSYFDDALRHIANMVYPAIGWYGDQYYIATECELRCWGKRLFNKRRIEWLSIDEIDIIHSEIRKRRQAKRGHKIA